LHRDRRDLELFARRERPLHFTLKDPGGGAAMRCAMFRRAASLLDFAPAEGQRVELRGRVAV